MRRVSFHLSRTLPPLFAALMLAACGTAPPSAVRAPAPPASKAADYFALAHPMQRQEIVLYALGLLNTGYRFGGRNPEAGLDCSGMVSYVVEQVSGLRLPHNAAQIAARTRPIALAQLQPGDLVFFNTLGRPHSHMGVYIGDGRFIHAPSSRGRVHIQRLDHPYFAPRIDGARSLLAGD
ncbi:MAG TPA: C40 family peptidase [Pseudothauera hydrothermalis]|nr:C40 family peptidase [Pseudothauera hydrothermalis]